MMDGWMKEWMDGRMEDVFFSLNISGDRGLSAFSLSTQTDSPSEGSMYALRGHARLTGEANERVVYERAGQSVVQYS